MRLNPLNESLCDEWNVTETISPEVARN